MPLYLKDRDISSDIVNVRSALIVPCRFCPAATLAVKEKKPYLELWKFFRSPSYESYIEALRSRLERIGIGTEIFGGKLPGRFVVCMWSSGRRKDLAERASGFDALIVLGCPAAVETARYSVKSRDCPVIPGMEVEGIMNVIPVLRFPFDIWLEAISVNTSCRLPKLMHPLDRF